MSSAAESFVIALGRASKRSGQLLRGLSKHDRDDVVATALLQCWENRATYDPAESLDDWFMDALKEARRSFKRGEYVSASEFNTEMGVPEDTSLRAEALEAATIIADSFTDREHRILRDRMDGASWREIIHEHRASSQEVGIVTAKLNRLRGLLPEERELLRVVRAGQMSDSMGYGEGETSEIDVELERIEFPPPAGKECPPCWRCKYFDGFAPVSYTPKQTVVDAEVQAAIWSNEQRKIEIANSRRDSWGITLCVV